MKQNYFLKKGMKNALQNSYVKKILVFMLVPFTKFDRQLYSFGCSFFSICMKSIITLVHWWKHITSLTIPYWQLCLMNNNNKPQFKDIGFAVCWLFKKGRGYHYKRYSSGKEAYKKSGIFHGIRAFHSATFIDSIYIYYLLKLSTFKLL